MNYIGKKLKSLRQELGLTQTEMAAGVISVSFYSKVERGLNDIGVNDFLDILQKHNVSPQNFFGDYKINEESKKEMIFLINKFMKVAYTENEDEITKIIKEFEKITPQTPFIKFSIMLAKLIVRTQDKSGLKRLNSKQKNSIRNLIFKESYNDEYYRIILIANLMEVYSVEDATFFVKNILRHYKDISKLDRKIKVALSVLVINYVDWCFRKNKFELCKEPLEYIKNMPNNIELAFSKILGLYFQEQIDGHKEKAKKIKDILFESGYKSIVRRM